MRWTSKVEATATQILISVCQQYSSIMPSKNEFSRGLSYVAQKPAFLQNFGQPQASPPAESSSSSSRTAPNRPGREPLPTRPDSGEWAGGSDDEDAGRKGRRNAGEDSDDEWGEVYGGGGEEGPQVVVLKEGRHLSAEEVKRERRRGVSFLSPFHTQSSRCIEQ